jgi:hypothetical protein
MYCWFVDCYRRKFYIKGNLLLTLGIYLSNQEQCEDTKGQSESVNRKGTDNTRSKSQMPFQTKKKREKKRIIYLLMTDSWMFPHYCNMTIYIMDMTLPWRLIKLYVQALVAIKCPFRSIMNFQDYIRYSDCFRSRAPGAPLILVGSVLFIYLAYCIMFLCIDFHRSDYFTYCCLCLWIIHSSLPLRFSLNYI